jgi:NTP pyrophosphatase (non-canonical NTP hydrolase)
MDHLIEAAEYIYKCKTNKRKMSKNYLAKKWSSIMASKESNEKGNIELSATEQEDLLADFELNLKFDTLIENVRQWAEDKGLIKIENAPKQVMKVNEEFGEFCSAVIKGYSRETKDGAGDTFVTLIILCFQLGLDPTECLEFAWNEIKDRTGKTVGGNFLKD